MAQTEIAGLILNGGRATRMGGVDKGAMDLAGRPMLAHVIDRIRPQVGRLAISIRLGATLPRPTGSDTSPAGRDRRMGDLAALIDQPGPSIGPIAGIEAGLAWAATLEPQPVALLVVPNDALLLPLNLVEGLVRAMPAGGLIRPAVAASFGRIHPVVSLWPLALAPAVRALAETARACAGNGGRAGSLGGALAALGAVAADFPAAPSGADPFLNINTPAALAVADAAARRG
ncbi:NTP transferase domain-containing protein [Tistrella bauzanensis]